MSTLIQKIESGTEILRSKFYADLLNFKLLGTKKAVYVLKIKSYVS